MKINQGQEMEGGGKYQEMESNEMEMEMKNMDEIEKQQVVRD